MEAWLRNPHNYIQQAVAEGWRNFVWQYGALDKRGIDPIRHLKAFRGYQDSRVLLVGDQGTAELSFKHPNRPSPKALYPTWEYGLNPIHQLYEWAETNVDSSQEHRVVITKVPSGNMIVGKQFLTHVEELQQEFPDTILHLHAMTRFADPARRGIASCDWEPFTIAKRGGVALPNGRVLNRFEEATKYGKWCLKNGFIPRELSDPKKRCVFNLRSYLWASQFWEGDMAKVSEPPQGHEDIFIRRTQEKVTKASLGRPKVGDMIICNHCTKWRKCPLYREGQVCTVEDSPGKAFSDHIGSKDPDTVIDGILMLVEDDFSRYEAGLERERADGSLDPEVTKLSAQLKKTALDIAKLRQPKGPLVKINNVAGSAQAVITDGSTTSDPHQVVAAAVHALESSGWDRSDISEEILKQYMASGIVPPAPTAVELPSSRDAEVIDVPSGET